MQNSDITLLHSVENNATILAQADYVMVKRCDLLQEHQALLARVQQLRRILGLKPLPTGKQQHRQERNK
jgi:hypothetical protein